jgi:hypothetical protein
MVDRVHAIHLRGTERGHRIDERLQAIELAAKHRRGGIRVGGWDVGIKGHIKKRNPPRSDGLV